MWIFNSHSISNCVLLRVLIISFVLSPAVSAANSRVSPREAKMEFARSVIPDFIIVDKQIPIIEDAPVERTRKSVKIFVTDTSAHTWAAGKRNVPRPKATTSSRGTGRSPGSQAASSQETNQKLSMPVAKRPEDTGLNSREERDSWLAL